MDLYDKVLNRGLPITDPKVEKYLEGLYAENYKSPVETAVKRDVYKEVIDVLEDIKNDIEESRIKKIELHIYSPDNLSLRVYDERINALLFSICELKKLRRKMLNPTGVKE